MEDVLLKIGSIVTAEICGENMECLIIGKRVQNPKNLKVWDYIAVPYPDGYGSSNRGGELGNTNVVFFNHMDIEETDGIEEAERMIN